MISIYFRPFLELDLVYQSSQRWNLECIMIQIILIIVTFTKHVISVMGSVAHTSHL
jgi:hypothetical protein